MAIYGTIYYAIHGGYGDDLIYGYDGDDLIYGYGGNDWIYSGYGDDALYGEDGQDYLVGGYGDDILIGSNPDVWNSGNGGCISKSKVWRFSSWETCSGCKITKSGQGLGGFPSTCNSKV